MRAIFAALCAMLVTVSCSAVETCPPTDQKAQWSASCFEGSAAARHVKREHLANIVADQTGHATILIGQPRELVAVDRRGVVVLPNIRHTGDYDYPDGRGGLARFQTAGGKCGYFDVRTFKIAIPAIYDQCLSFQDDAANVCNDCKIYCTEPECQSSKLVGGTGYAIDNRNKIVKRFAPPPLNQSCNGAAPAKVVQLSEASAYLQCPPVDAGLFQVR
jgi:hypothetical protein